MLDRLRRSLRYRLGMNQTNITSERPSSYPFISGDSFRALADFIIEDEADFAKISENLSSVESGLIVLFVSLSLLEEKRNQVELCSVLAPKGQVPYEVRIILHNSDYNVPEQFLCSLLERCSHIFCVNYLGTLKGVTSIPIGLENLHFVRGGLISRFPYRSHKTSLNKRYFKVNIIFSGFNVSTNRKVREPIDLVVRSSQYSEFHHFVPPDQYIPRLSSSFFSISPPGNGADCHRTWESLYLGTIPVILDGHLSKSLTDNLPIHVVSDYQSFLELSPNQLRELYSYYSGRSLQIAYMKFWTDKIFASGY